jgi:uncharacterized protein
MKAYQIGEWIAVDNLVGEWEPALAERVYTVVANESTGHDLYHCLRVKALAVRIAEGEGLDPEILAATSYLHDLGRGREFEGHGDHVTYGMEQAARVRGEILGFQDADRLDAIGAVGLARMFTFGGAYRQPLWHPGVKPGHWEHGDLGSSSYNHLHEKLLKLKDTMNTATGRRIAEGRHAFMVQFAAQFEKEWVGKA